MYMMMSIYMQYRATGMYALQSAFEHWQLASPRIVGIVGDGCGRKQRIISK